MTTDSQIRWPEPTVAEQHAAPVAAERPAAGLSSGSRPAVGRGWTGHGRLARITALGGLPLADVVAITAAASTTRMPAVAELSYLACVLAVLAIAGQYRNHITQRVVDQLGRIVAAAAIGVPVLPYWLPFSAALRVSAAAAIAVIVTRSLAYHGLRVARRHDLAIEPVVLVGAGDAGVQIADLLREHPETGLRPVGFLATSEQAHDLPLPVIGEPADLLDAISAFRVRRLIVCSAVDGDSELVHVIRACQALPVSIWLLPRLPELGGAMPKASLDEIWGVPVMPLRRVSPGSMAVKRAFDVMAAAILLVLFAPVLVVLAAAIRLRSGHPVIFRQVRVTGDQQVAEIMKLRTLPLHDDSDTRWSVLQDESTGLGRWLRASHLDELPQLLNVLRGEMSLVGPRPERPYFVERFSPAILGYSDRHRMRAGLTGWAQVHGLHGDTSIADRVRFDNQYIDNWSLWLDAVILIKTFGILLSSKLPGRQ